MEHAAGRDGDNQVPAARDDHLQRPGTGIQLTLRALKSRLIVPFNEGPYGLWQNDAVSSDDTGKT